MAKRGPVFLKITYFDVSPIQIRTLAIQVKKRIGLGKEIGSDFSPRNRTFPREINRNNQTFQVFETWKV